MTTLRSAAHGLARGLWPQPLVGTLSGVLGLLAVAVAWRATPGSPLAGVDPGGGATALCLVVAVVVAYHFPLALRPKVKVYLASVPYYLLVALAPPALAVAAGGVAALLGELSVRRARGNRAGDIASEAGRRALVLLGGALVAHRGSAGGAPLGAALALAAFALLAGDIMTAPLVLAPITGETPARIVGAVAREAWLTEGAQYLLGVLGALAAARAPWAPALLVAPLALGYRALAAAQGARTAAERAAEELQHEASHDPLTGLPNRALLQDRLGRALARRARPGEAGGVGVLYVDLDRFKVVNDSLGHAAGDALLVTVAGRLAGCVRAGDTVARLGGDEFALLLDGLGEASQAVRTAERVIRALDAPVRLDGHDVVTAASIGIALTVATPATPTTTAVATADLLRDADVALYRAKAAGRGRYAVFDAAMNAQALERLELEAELRRGLRRGEFVVYYQPKVELATGRVAGMEALARWQSPTRGLVEPGAFIPLAEETGLIRPLGRWVLEEACRQARRWTETRAGDAGPIAISVNLSARQLTQPGLVEDVARALAESGVGPGLLELEITESAAMGDAAATIATLGALKGLGVRLAIDDFGTGYSSLAYLKRFPLDVLKIDRAFVVGLGRGSEDASIVAAVVGLGRALGLAVVAEGVETAAEAAQLRALGCALGQGYHFARPLPRAEAEALVSGGQPVA